MKKIFKIFFRDVNTIRKNTAALIIIIGICLLPSLYAWINIKACWNPYANTGNLPVAVVNEDQGTVFNGKVINVGNNIVSELKKNKSIGWVFVDDWQGNYGLNQGKYYALIDIPNNFSSGFVSLASTSPQKPSIVYRVNEKLNAIAAKITNVAKDKLVESIKSKFVSTVNSEAMVLLKSDVQSANLNKSQILEIKDTFTEANTNITSLKQYIDSANSDSESLNKYLNTAGSSINKITDEINCLEKVTSAGKSLTICTKQTVDSLSRNLNSDITNVQSLNEQNKNLLFKLKDVNSNSIDKDLINIMKESGSICDSLHVMLSSDVKNLTTVNNVYSSSVLTSTINNINDLDKLVTTEETKLNALIPLVSSGSPKDAVSSSIDALSGLSDEITKKTQDLSGCFYSGGSEVLSNMTGNLSTKLDDINSILDLTKTIIPELNAVSTFGTAGSRISADNAGKLNSKLTAIQTDLNKLSDKMNTLTSGNVDKIADIVENHPTEIADFISSPIDVKDMEVYNTGLFGVGLTPFYTVLAIWVGSLLLCALLSVECDDIEGVHLNLKQKHFGKMLLFLSLSLIQTTIIVLGDVYILGVKPENMTLLMLISYLSSVTFTVIIFTLVSLFGNGGKAVAVVMMVFQIAGSGGIYPIQTNPKIFGILQPLWPFTYAINGFREALAGPVWKSVYSNVLALSVFIGVFLALAIFKKPFHKITGFFEEKYKEAGL